MKGDAKLQYILGNKYDSGNDVAQAQSTAFEWYELAAENGNADAQFNLGLLYDLGKGVSQDKQEAVKWYRKAAVQGNTDAQNALLKLQQEPNYRDLNAVEPTETNGKSLIKTAIGKIKGMLSLD